MDKPDRTFLAQPIKDRADAELFIATLVDREMLFHFEDSPDDIIMGATGELLFAESEWEDVRARVREMYALDWTICECPIGFALLCDDVLGCRDLERALITLLTDYCAEQGLELMSADDMLFCENLTPEQRAWLTDYSATWDRMMDRREAASA